MGTSQLIDATEMDALRERMQERRWLMAASCIIALGIFLTYHATTQSFEALKPQLEAGAVVNLSTLESSRTLLPVLETVYRDPADQRIVAEHIYAYVLWQRSGSLLPWTLSNVGRLNTTALAIPARKVESGGAVFKGRLARSREKLGMTPGGTVIPPDTTVVAPPPGPYHLQGKVTGTDGKPLAGITVTLRGMRAADTRTDAEGRYRFAGLAEGDQVVVRPVHRYHSFASRANGAVSGNGQFHFKADEHRIAIFDNVAELQALKPKLIVRSPAIYIWTLVILAVIYFAAFYGLHLFWFRRRFAGDAVLLPIVHLLTGLALVLMFSLPDPLRDLMRAQGFVGGFLGGLLLLGIFSQVDLQHRFWRKQTFSWLGLGVVLAAVLYFFGSGPTGSSAKVNLNVPVLGSVQPVELIKLCLVLFLAGYFAQNWVFLRELKQREGLPAFLQRLNLPRYRDLVPVTVGVVVALFTFFALSDMGPALVIACTFLVLYGIVRNRWPASTLR